MAKPLYQIPPTESLPEMPDVQGRLSASSAAAEFSSTSTYAVRDRCVYLGVLYRCVVAKTTASATTPDNDIYNATSAPTNHWVPDVMTEPEASLDIMASGAMRVVSSGGEVLWMQGYDRKTTSSDTLANETENMYTFGQDATDTVAITLPTPLANPKKVSDLIFCVSNPALAPDFDETATYAVNARVMYQGECWTCSTAVSTAGAWTGTTNWTKTYAAYDPTNTAGYALNATCIYDSKLWKCTEAIASGSAAGAFDEAKWSTASMSISGNPDSLRIAVPAGEVLTDLLTFAYGTYTQLYFTLTTFDVGGKPTWKLVRQNLEVA